MAIDQKYGLPSVSSLRPYSTDQFSKNLHNWLLNAINESEKLWDKIEVDAFLLNNVAFLRIALDLGIRPLYLYLHSDGDVLQIDTPIFLDFPQEASYFVLNKLCGSTTNLSFRVDKYVSMDESGLDSRPSGRKINVLYGWRRCELDVFVESAHELLPFLIAKFLTAEMELRVFLDRPMRDPLSLEGPVCA